LPGTPRGDRWFVEGTYVKVNGVWRYVYRAIDQHGQVIDVLVSKRRDAEAARQFFGPCVEHVEGDTDRGAHRRCAHLSAGPRRSGPGSLASRRALRKQAGRGRPRPTQTPAATLRGLRTDRTAKVIIAGLAFMQNLRRGHYELATETPHLLRVIAASAELASAI
jgi:transposase, IS6 family